MASILKRGEYQYQATIRRKGYPSQSKTFETRQAAQMWAREQESKMDSGKFADRKEVERTTLGDALTRYMETVTIGKKSNRQEITRIKMFLRHPLALRSLDSLRAKDFASYRDGRLKEVSSNTVRLEIALLSHLYTIAIKEWSMPLEHEVRNIRKPPAGAPRERRLEGDEEARLRASFIERADLDVGIWLKACFDLAIETGMRAGEILGLSWSQINLAAGVVRLTHTKNGSNRSVPLTVEAVAVLERLPRHYSGKVIPNFYDTSGLDRAFKKLCASANIGGLHFHDLRHEAASRLAPHMQVQLLAKVMGWKTLQMAMRYYNPTETELVMAVRGARAA